MNKLVQYLSKEEIQHINSEFVDTHGTHDMLFLDEQFNYSIKPEYIDLICFEIEEFNIAWNTWIKSYLFYKQKFLKSKP